MSLSRLLAQIEPRVLVLLLAGGLAVLALAGWQLTLREQVRSYRQLVAERGQSAEEVSREQAGLAGVDLAAAKDAVQRLERRLYGDAPGIPASQMASHVIGLLDGLARDHQVHLAGVKPGPQAEVLGFTEVPFDVEVRGDYGHLIAWLEAAEHELRPMVVKRFRIEPAQGATDAGGTLRMELRVVSYRAPRLS